MSWWHRLWRRAQMEEQLEEELRFHLEQHEADLMARGHTAAEARRLARLALGGPEQVKEACRDARGTRWLEDLWQDVRYALRTLRQRPGFAAVALLTLALGTGATTVMFTVINGVLLKPLPYADPGRLVRVQEKTDYSTPWGDLWAFTYPNFRDCQGGSRSLDLAAWHYAGGTITEPGPADYADRAEISANLFPVLGVGMRRGRSFLAGEDRPGAPPVAIISSGMWQRRYGGSPRAIGAPLIFNGKSYTVVGIAPPNLRISGNEFDVFTLLGQDPSPRMRNREAHGIQVWARRRPGATLAQAEAELAVIGRQLAAHYPKSNQGRSFVAEPLRPDVGDVRATLWLLLGAVTLVLLIACVNIASLLLARAVSRERELAMRMALGAGRGRLARQGLTESAVLGVGGGLLGLVLAVFGMHPFLTFWPGTLPRAGEVRLDGHVLAFALAVALASGLLFGLAPALRVPVRGLEQALRAGARGIAASSRRLHRGLVVSEIALAAVLLMSAGMLGRTLVLLSARDPGVNIHDMLTARVALSPATLADRARTRAAWQEVLERARRVPGVQSAAIVDTVPMRQGYNAIGYRTSAAALPDNRQPLVSATCVTPDYLKVAGLRLRRGRFLSDQDRMGSGGAAVIDEVMARQAFAGRDPIGQHLWIGLGSDPVTVVGMVGHVRYWGAGDDQAQVRAQLYYPFAQVPDQYMRRWSELMSIAVRTGVPPLGVVEPLRREVRGVTGDQVLYEVRTLEQLAGAALARQRFLLLLFGIFAGLALLLACIGIYGVQAYLTSRRVPEIGVRMALGAGPREVQWMVLREGLGMILAGLAAGTLAALAAARVLLRLVEGMQPGGPQTFAIMIPVLVAAALVAGYLPARRASRVDPVSALRQE
jgi:putative ABC transport system permease protein